MIYRGPGFLAVVWFRSQSTYTVYLEYRMSVRKLSLFLSLPVLRRSILLTGKGGPDGGGAKLYDGEKA